MSRAAAAALLAAADISLLLLLRVTDVIAEVVHAVQDLDHGCLSPAEGPPDALDITVLEVTVGAERV
ncbi:hypothetical protein OHT76_00335 [Streptomyces sp. NBC_00287]|uniref:hypothetical protein n=1 Tax=Streptomyces sp. NBC_00287 TaxID=2975702 RepID=UPI002E285B1A|nr:hypothetical protein [Streptomyces sp. NBC_00287]